MKQTILMKVLTVCQVIKVTHTHTNRKDCLPRCASELANENLDVKEILEVCCNFAVGLCVYRTIQNYRTDRNKFLTIDLTTGNVSHFKIMITLVTQLIMNYFLIRFPSFFCKNIKTWNNNLLNVVTTFVSLEKTM